MRLKKNSRPINFRNVKQYLSFGVVLLCLYPFIKECDRRKAIKNDDKEYMKAVVNEKSYLPNNPVSAKFYYQYQFKVNDNVYNGTTMDSKYHPGDSIEIEYVKNDPDKNCPKGYYK
ncbi:hypothetical protein [Adhaeribacter terreus]|uniref:DUF3592 domain-containing protein n=1 Tax=Adhaeribacter terreus TaxID=529703 RepID=A0ABW0E831_9BACT